MFLNEKCIICKVVYLKIANLIYMWLFFPFYYELNCKQIEIVFFLKSDQTEVNSLHVEKKMAE